jgi:ubiquinone biosynthesis protein
MLKAIAQIEASAVALAPEFDVFEEARPYVRRVFMDRFRPGRAARDAATVGREFAQLVRDSPAALRELIRVLTGGGVRVSLEMEHMPEMLGAGNRIANRLAFALVLGASLVGSAILAAAKVPPTWNGISLLGIGGFLVALVMSAWLVVSIVRHGRL